MKRILLLCLLVSFVISCYCESASVDSSRFIQVDGTMFRTPDGRPWIGRGVAFGNSVWNNPSEATSFKHHRMEDYGRVKAMGFNSVRFYINYALFESDSRPGQYREQGFSWLDQNIAAARDQGVGLILNMHYPQGGFQSNGAGDALWNSKKNQDRLVALWKEIAKRYRGEPVIIGYGLVNEPVPVHGIEEWEALAQRLITAIREVDAHHIIFVERAIWLKSGSSNEISSRLFFPKGLSDPSRQLALEFHFYEPMGFTHQNTSWTGWKGLYASYPDEGRIEVEDAQWAGFARASHALPAGNTSWRELGGTPVTCENPSYLVAYPTVQTQGLGAKGRVWIEELRVEASSDGGVTWSQLGLIEGSSLSGCDFWSSDGSGSLSLTHGKGKNDKTITVSGTGGDANITFRGIPIVCDKNQTYRLTGRLRGESVSKTAMVRLRLDFYSGKSLTAWNKRNLESRLASYITYARQQGVPLYLGEFGLASDAFREQRGGLNWVEDMLDILVSNNMSYNYHTWKESAFGIYQNDSGYADPSRVNSPLEQAFIRMHNPERGSASLFSAP